LARKRKTPRTHEAHEAKCRRCGLCCRDKYLVDDRMFFAGEGHCQYFDPETKHCTIYEDRHEINPQCLSVKDGIALGVFPKDCPYVQDLPDYVPPFDEPIDKDTLRLIERGQITNPRDLEAHLIEKAAQAPTRRKRRKR